MSKKIKLVNTVDSDDVSGGDNLLSFLDINPNVSSFNSNSNFTFSDKDSKLQLSDKNSSVSISFNSLQSIQIDDENIQTIFLKPQDQQVARFGDLFKKTTIDMLMIGKQSIDNNKLWKNIVLGGTFRDQTFQPKIDINRNFHYENTSFSSPRTSIESEFLFGTIFQDVYSGKLKFNYFDNDYFTEPSAINEWELPNIFLFLIESKKRYEPTKILDFDFKPKRGAFTGRGIGGGPLFRSKSRDPNPKSTERRFGSISKVPTKIRTETYYEPSFRDFTSLRGGIEFSPTMINSKETARKLLTEHRLSSKPGQIPFNRNSDILIDTAYANDDFDEIAKNCPFYTRFQIPLEGLGPIGSILDKHELLFKFMSGTKDVILSKGLVDFFNGNNQFRKKYYNLILSPDDDSTSNSLRTYTDQEVSNEIPFKIIDFSDFMAEEINCLDDPITNDSIQVVHNSIDKKLGASQTYSNKYELNIRMNKAYAEIIDYLDKNEIRFEDMIEGKECHSEVLYYRLQKAAGQQATDQREQQVLQSFYFTNREQAGSFVYYDSQIFPNKNYTYTLFEYRLIVGMDYTYNNVFYSQKFSSEDGCALMVNEEAPETPITNVNNLFGNVFEDARNRAEAQVTYQTSLRLHEVPIIVQDLPAAFTPPVQPVVQFNSYPHIANTVFISVDTEVGGYTTPYQPLTQEDSVYINNVYLSNNLLEREVPINTQISISNIELRIVHEPPTDFSSFSNPDRIESFVFEDQNGPFDKSTIQLSLDEGRDHYCVIRSQNAIGNFSSPRQIYRLRINNEAGFRTLEVEYYNPFKEEERAITTTKDLNRLVRIKLADAQRLSNVSLIDSANTKAEDFISEQLNIRNESLVQKSFNKKFKLRLTSKATGKKVDFNFTFKVKKENSTI